MKPSRTVSTFLFIKILTQTYLVQAFITQNKYLTPRLKEDNNIISARSAAKSLSLKYTFLSLNFLITGFRNS